MNTYHVTACFSLQNLGVNFCQYLHIVWNAFDIVIVNASPIFTLLSLLNGQCRFFNKQCDFLMDISYHCGTNVNVTWHAPRDDVLGFGWLILDTLAGLATPLTFPTWHGSYPVGRIHVDTYTCRESGSFMTGWPRRRSTLSCGGRLDLEEEGEHLYPASEAGGGWNKPSEQTRGAKVDEQHLK